MGDTNVDDGESDLHGRSLTDVERKKATKGNTDTVLRLNDEEDTLYEDGLEVEDDSTPLTGINGRDDTTKIR
jgi:hypothetical protein